MDNTNRWRPIIAALANPETRRIAAELMLGATLADATADLSPSRRRRVTDTLAQTGILGTDGAFKPEVFRAILDSAAVPRREGIQRFVDGQRIRQYPASAHERGELLAWVARGILSDGDVLSEREVNERLLPYTEDVAVLRRYLVDYQLVERSPDGTGYALSAAPPTPPAD